MVLEFHFLLGLVAIGLFRRQLHWRGWMGVALLVAAWITLCKIRG